VSYVSTERMGVKKLAFSNGYEVTFQMFFILMAHLSSNLYGESRRKRIV